MNWGYKILFVYLAFVAGIIVMVVKSSSQKTDLVTTDYYAKELRYQDRIDAVNRTATLSAPLAYEVANQQLIIRFPKEFSGKQVTATVLLYCPSNEEKDISSEYSGSGENININIPQRNTGAHELQVNWKADGKEYFFSDKLFL